VPVIAQVLPAGGPIVIATDWIRTYPELVAPWLPANRLILGTDGFGRSDAREALRSLFEIDPPHIAAAAIVGLARDGRLTGKEAAAAMRELGVDPDAPDPRSL
jgi:pyruvate dehydrogenase E1 component